MNHYSHQSPGQLSNSTRSVGKHLTSALLERRLMNKQVPSFICQRAPSRVFPAKVKYFGHAKQTLELKILFWMWGETHRGSPVATQYLTKLPTLIPIQGSCMGLRYPDKQNLIQMGAFPSWMVCKISKFQRLYNAKSHLCDHVFGVYIIVSQSINIVPWRNKSRKTFFAKRHI